MCCASVASVAGGFKGACRQVLRVAAGQGPNPPAHSRDGSWGETERSPREVQSMLSIRGWIKWACGWVWQRSHSMVKGKRPFKSIVLAKSGQPLNEAALGIFFQGHQLHWL